jgi:hypothetical protein
MVGSDTTKIAWFPCRPTMPAKYIHYRLMSNGLQACGVGIGDY